jgi:hypothetical protein
MQRVQFIGRVFPSAIKVTVSLPELKWKWVEQSLELTFRVKIGNSFVNVECDIDSYKQEYFHELYRRALDLARASVNLIGFAHGFGLTVMLEAIIMPDGAPSEIALIDNQLAPLCTAYSVGTEGDINFSQVLNAVVMTPDLFMALDDLIQAITLPHAAPVNCARAMDRLKFLIAGTDLSDKQAWQRMRDALQLDEGFLRYITDVSKNPRHGRPGRTPGSEAGEATRRAWAVMNRYFEYVKRGRQPLSLPDFPLLK